MPKMRKLTFVVPSAFSQTKPQTPLLPCVPVNDAYENLSNTNGKYASSLDTSASVSSCTTSTSMTNPAYNKVPQRRNTKAEAKERQHQQDSQKEHNHRSRTNTTLKARRRNN